MFIHVLKKFRKTLEHIPERYFAMPLWFDDLNNIIDRILLHTVDICRAFTVNVNKNIEQIKEMITWRISARAEVSARLTGLKLESRLTNKSFKN